ncbi:sulfur carrier protein ThiS [Ramlibacter tataouinensis]|uniref:sulfur carrier protein ThiS n=1 Tax=Ramlibacter tataouinensis TaxID=94132 RepID=UPI0022F3832B|nr:sulfur carrier protein ThiS [Ramlibacter tataouinensis]WBY02273.1 sulfur carrier protein ThiS [Ramlibacter tataouinensis]
MITIQLNRERLQFPDGTSLAALVAALDRAPAALATAVNGEFVARELRGQHLLRDGDVVLTFEPITGG